MHNGCVEACTKHTAAAAPTYGDDEAAHLPRWLMMMMPQMLVPQMLVLQLQVQQVEALVAVPSVVQRWHRAAAQPRAPPPIACGTRQRHSAQARRLGR